MKKILLLLTALCALTAHAQIQDLDLTTRTTNTAVATYSATVSNAFTNAVITLTKTNNVVIGEPLSTGNAKVKANFDWLKSVVRTNGAGTNGMIPFYTNGAPGYYWGLAPTNGSGGGLSAINVTNNGVIFKFDTNGQFSISNTITHAYNNFGTNGHQAMVDQYGNNLQMGTNYWRLTFTNGTGINFSNGLFTVNSNLLVNGDSWLNNSNLHIHFIPAETNGLIPVMADYTNPSGTVSASSEFSTSYAYLAFDNYDFTNTQTGWASNPGTQTNWVQYRFPNQVTVSKFIISVLVSNINPGNVYVQSSQDGSSWTTLYLTNFNGYGLITNYFPKISAQYFRLNMASDYALNNSVAYAFQLYGDLTSRDVIDDTNLLVINTGTNGMAINTNTARGYSVEVAGTVNVDGALTVNDQPIGTQSGVGSGTGFPWLATTNLLVYNASKAFYNGTYNPDPVTGYFTNSTGVGLLIPPGVYVSTSNYVVTLKGYLLCTNTEAVDGLGFWSGSLSLGVPVNLVSNSVAYYSFFLTGGYIPCIGNTFTNTDLYSSYPIVTYQTNTFNALVQGQIGFYTNLFRAGEVTVATAATTTTATFSSPYPVGVTNYTVLLTPSGFSTFPNAMYANRTTNGFDITTISVVGGGKVSYQTRQP